MVTNLLTLPVFIETELLLLGQRMRPNARLKLRCHQGTVLTAKMHCLPGAGSQSCWPLGLAGISKVPNETEKGIW